MYTLHIAKFLKKSKKRFFVEKNTEHFVCAVAMHFFQLFLSQRKKKKQDDVTYREHFVLYYNM